MAYQEADHFHHPRARLPPSRFRRESMAQQEPQRDFRFAPTSPSHLVLPQELPSHSRGPKLAAFLVWMAPSGPISLRFHRLPTPAQDGSENYDGFNRRQR